VKEEYNSVSFVLKLGNGDEQVVKSKVDMSVALCVNAGQLSPRGVGVDLGK